MQRKPLSVMPINILGVNHFCNENNTTVCDQLLNGSVYETPMQSLILEFSTSGSKQFGMVPNCNCQFI